MKIFKYFILPLFLILNVYSYAQIDNFLTPPYQEINFNDEDTGKIYFYFTDEITEANFSSIYLKNSTEKEIHLYNDSKHFCTFLSKLVRCIIPHSQLNADNNNQDDKFYYMLKYIMNNGSEQSGLVTVAVSSEKFIKIFSLFLLFFIF